MSKEFGEWGDNAKELMALEYPFNKEWVASNLNILNEQRAIGIDDRAIVFGALAITRNLAEKDGINKHPDREKGFYHIPSRIEAIRIFEEKNDSFYKGLTLEKSLEILIIAEMSNLRGSIPNGFLSIEPRKHLEQLGKLIAYYKELDIRGW